MPDHRQITQEFRVESDDWGRFDWQAGLFCFDEDITIDSFNYDSLAPGNPQTGLRACRTSATRRGRCSRRATSTSPTRSSCAAACATPRTRRTSSPSVHRSQSPFGAAGRRPVRGQHRRRRRQLGPQRRLRAERRRQRVRTRRHGLPRAVDPGPPRVRARPHPTARLDRRLGRSHLVRSRHQGRPVGQAARASASTCSATTSTTSSSSRSAAAPTPTILLNADKTTRPGLRAGPRGLPDRHPAGHLGQQLQRHRDRRPRPRGCAVRRRLHGDSIRRVTIRLRPGTVLIDGNPLPQAPKWVHNLTARYGMPVGDGGEFFVYTDWAYRSEVNFFLYESTEFTGKSLLEGGLRVGYNWDQRQVRSGRVRPQHHRPDPHRRRHRLQQPDRLHQRAADVRRGVHRALLSASPAPPLARSAGGGWEGVLLISFCQRKAPLPSPPLRCAKGRELSPSARSRST